MSVSEILHEIEALPSADRLELIEKLTELTEPERIDLEAKLKQRPNLGAELAEKIQRMQTGKSVDLEEAQALHHQLEKLGL